MDNYIVLFGLIVLVVFIKASWVEYIMMSSNPSNYRKSFLDYLMRREMIFELLHKIYTHPKFTNRDKSSITKNIDIIRSVVKDYLKDNEQSNSENTKN